MNDSVDLRNLLIAWPYDAENDTRIVLGDDGRQVLQVRTPLGIEQFELDGRPDGSRPHGMGSALEYQLSRLEKATQASENPTFSIGSSDCIELFNESTLYYFRYVRLFQLRDWPRTIRDTDRNIRVFDLIHRYAEREEDRSFLEKWRPYVVRVKATATAMHATEKKDYDAAVRTIKDAISAIEAMDEQDDETFKFERERSLTALRDLNTQIQRDRPLSQLEKLEHQLRRAIERQEFERAAELRDKIKAAKTHH